MPWFFCQFPTATTGDIEVRICHDQAFTDEGVAFRELQAVIIAPDEVLLSLISSNTLLKCMGKLVTYMFSAHLVNYV